MSRKVFDYAGISTIEVEGPKNLLERIAENVEEEIEDSLSPSCRIKINQSESPVEIEKNKQFAYLTINKTGTAKQPAIRYTRYNTHVRTIHQKSPNNYEVYANVALDESSGLICIRNHLSNHPELTQYPLLHASLINIDGAGILIPGNSKQGKTTLATYLLQEQEASFISDENVILDEKQLKGLYVPRTPRVRFSTIAESGLSKVLGDISIANATQYIDPDAIKRIIDAPSFDIDAGIAFSRKVFCDLLGTISQESSFVDVVLFPIYKEGGNLKVRKLGSEEGVQRLSKTGLIRKSHIDPKELKETVINLNASNFKGVDFVEVGFSGLETLRQGGFRI